MDVRERSVSEGARDARISLILTMLAQRGELQVRYLPALLGVSGPTVRRDLAVMEDKGLVRRSYGRVAVARHSAELPVSLRRSQNTEAKRRIGALACSLIPTRPLTVALSGGSTVGFAARLLASRANLTVVTNGLDTATVLASRPVVDVVVTGGQARPLFNDLVGKTTEWALRDYQFDFAMVGADGISPVAGVTQHSSSGAKVTRVMLEQARKRIVLADSSKLGRVHAAKVADSDAVHTVVTDSHANMDLVRSLRRLGLNVIVVAVPPAAKNTRRLPI
ncbi:DeoR/GlpR family DNA-binding transcription regulator [Streptomyces griseofuscus]|uniref:DeoR/GlpR family DNA-binding transcription regulator n=1 Tax=Streptomyces griseofuscus TaxID=146922 RepID=UPI0036B9F9A3